MRLPDELLIARMEELSELCASVIHDPDREDERAAIMWEFAEAIADVLDSVDEDRELRRRKRLRLRARDDG